MRSTVLVALLCIAVAAGAHGASWFVSPDGDDSNNGSENSPFSTIQRAVDTVSEGDTVVLLPGVFTGEGNYDVKIKDTITVTASDQRQAVLSWSDPDRDDDDFHPRMFYVEDDVDATFIGLKMVGAPVAIELSDPGHVAIDQCEFQYCDNGIAVDDLESNLRITNCFFHQISETAVDIIGNDDGDVSIQASTFGGCDADVMLNLEGLERVLMRSVVFYNNQVDRVIDSFAVNQLEMFQCTVVQNSGEDGVVVVDECDVFSLHDTVFQMNRAHEQGGALSVDDTEFMRADNVTFMLNSSPTAGGGLVLMNTVGLMDQCTFANNSVTTKDEDGGGAMYVTEDSRVLISNSLIANNLGGAMGGAASVEDAFLDVDSCKVSGNTAVVGGAFQCTDDGRVRVADSVLTDNVSLSGDDGDCKF